jgi:dTDP-L-rhamnose 4-epimerase
LSKLRVLVTGGAEFIGTVGAADYQAVDIGAGEPSSILDLAQMLAKLLGDDEPELVGQYPEGDIRHCVADISRARDGLGFTPAMAVADGLTDLVDWGLVR